MARVRANFFTGTLSSQLLAGATTMMSTALASFPVVGSPDVAFLVIGNDTDTKEIVKVTAHVESATPATIERAQDGTTDRTWPAGTLVRQAPLQDDLPWVGTTVEYEALAEVDPSRLYVITD